MSTTIAPNVLDDGRRYIATASIGRAAHQRKRKRFMRTTPLRTVEAWIEDTRAALRKQKRTTARLKGTFAGEVVAYLPTVSAARRKETQYLLQAWILALGDVKRATLILPGRLQRVVDGWIEAGRAATTLQHRRRALAQFAEARQDQELAAIVRAVKVPQAELGEPRAVNMDLLQAILIGMDAHGPQAHPGRGGRGFRNKQRARLLVLLWSGMSPASLRRLEPQAVDLEAQRFTLPRRKKGKGAASVTLPMLGGRAFGAFQEWLRAFAWGPFDKRGLTRAFKRAIRAYVTAEAAAGRLVAVPADLTVRDLRHSFLSWLWESEQDPLAVQEYAQHCDMQTTRRYTRGAVGRRLAAIAAQVTAREAKAPLVSELQARLQGADEATLRAVLAQLETGALKEVASPGRLRLVDNR